jgi:aspartyl-tRNA(Asn)/glutamyl-tRNA(Gln) amidotransferase subunit B
LPVLNREVFRLGLRAVLALGGEPSTLVKFDRKNYFYPDLPKGYQISQFAHPLGRGGAIEIHSGGKTKKIRLNRLHLEEDAGKLLHDQLPDSSIVDLNRAGTPLAEIVSEPDLESPAEAYDYLISLKAILRAVGVSECDMEKGQLRCDANVSVRKSAPDPLGKRVEIKNLNSFKAVKAAIEHEVARQSVALEKGEILMQETRLWDDDRQKTFVMRSKEEAHDYRYFPEPDLVPFSVKKEEVDRLRASMPELPDQKNKRYVEVYGLSAYDAGLLTQEVDTSDFFERCLKTRPVVSGQVKAKEVVNWITGPVFQCLKEKKSNVAIAKVQADPLIELILMVSRGLISMQIGKEKVLSHVLDGHDPGQIVKREGLAQVSDDSALTLWITEVIQANPKVVAEIKSGKDTAAMFLVGQVMKKSQGKANPIKVKELMAQKLADVN